MKTNLNRIKNDLENLAKFATSEDGGITRLSLTEEDRMTRDYLKKELRALDLKIHEDPMGNLFARREGSQEDAPTILIGSHFDSVKNGGNFDGMGGVITALEILRVLDENKVDLKNSLEFVSMIEEEGGRFGIGLLGSRAMIGDVDYEELEETKDKDGISVADALRDFGLDPEKIEEADRSKENIRAFIELHIEQGPVLEDKSKDIGIVELIVGMKGWEITISGEADHAGTTPMDMRRDPVVAASRVISKIDGYALEEKEGTVATVGSIEVKPGASNVVAREVIFTLDVRSRSDRSIETVKAKILGDLDKFTRETGTSFEISEKLNSQAIEMSEGLIENFKKSSEELGLSYILMPSGAGHDAMILSEITEVALIFVPSKAGKSHSKDEWTDYEQLQKGIELIYNTVVKLGNE